MKISPAWVREFVSLKTGDRQIAQDLTQAGIAVESISQQGGQSIFEMDITTNRVDAMNHYGVARECSAIYGRPLQPIVPRLPEAKAASRFPIEIAAPRLCWRYTARIIRNVSIGASPAATAARLAAMESTRINNVVDASNYTLMEMGHPTHAFDLDLLEGGKIIVRPARPGETLKTLDGVERKLHPDDLVIADARKPVALAGVMGGFDSMINPRTRNILIESAWFDPLTVRQSSRRHGLHTDASHRFERGADYAATSRACARVAELVLQTAGGELAGPEIDVIGRKLRRPPLRLRRAEMLRVLGQPIPEKDLLRILPRLGFTLQKKSRDQLQAQLPSWRLDVEREIDLIEEVARVYGYNNFKNTLPPFSGAVVELPSATRDARVRSTFLALGYDEAISSTFISPEDAERFSNFPGVRLANPLNAEAAVMRTSLLPGMLNMLSHNLNRGSNRLRLFEQGRAFELAGQGAVEHPQACLGATGAVARESVHERPRDYAFFDLKGDVEAVLSAFDCRALYFDEHSAVHYHPGRSARAVMDGAVVARFGELHPEVAAARKLKQRVYLAELFLERLYQHPLRQPRYAPASRFPAVERDFSFTFAAGVAFQQLRSAVEALAIPELQDFLPADLLRGRAAQQAGIPAGHYSLLLRARFQAPERTLRDDEVAAWSQAIIRALQELGGKLRG